MKIATWNVNSLRAREDLVLDWIESNEPDVLALQETKITDQEFPEDGFGDLDYEVVYYGQSTYNGVALCAGDEIEDVVRGFPDDDEDTERRIIVGTVGGITVIDIYLPNGQRVDSDKYRYKLDWMKKLQSFLETRFDPKDPIVLCGDFNIAPGDLDHYWAPSDERRLFATPEERGALQRMLDWGLVDAYRELYPDERAYTWWDYRGRTYPRNEGLRIDLLLITAPLRERLIDVVIDRSQRAGDAPSDHVPVVLELED